MSSSPRATLAGSRVLLAEHAAGLPTLRIASPSVSLPTLQNEEEAAEQRAEELRLAFEAGRREARQEAEQGAARDRRETLAECAKHLVNAAAQVAADRQEMLDTVVEESVELVFGLLESLLDAELQLRSDATREAVRRAIRLAPPDEDLIVRVHPDAGLAADDFFELLGDAPVTVREDPTVERTGAIVEAGACRIDAQIGPALERVRRVLEDSLAAPGEVG